MVVFLYFTMTHCARNYIHLETRDQLVSLTHKAAKIGKLPVEEIKCIELRLN